MKRLVITSLTALGLLLAMQQPASAYCKFKFGIGFNISWEGANNSFLFGLLKGGPGPAGYDGGSPVDGGIMQGGPMPYSHGMTQDGFGTPPSANPNATSRGQPGMAQPVSYSAYQQMGGYQGPNYGQGGYQVPSYWYGR